MIACIPAKLVHDHLRSLGFVLEPDDPMDRHQYWSRRDGVIVQMNRPNIFGEIPVELAESALDAAGVPVPDWPRDKWCD